MYKIKRITGDLAAKWNKQQEEAIMKMVERKIFNLILSGGSGRGKTLLLCQALQILRNQLKELDEDIKIFVTSFNWTDKKLIEKLQEEYLSVATQKMTVTNMEDLCRTLKQPYDVNAARKTLNDVIAALSVKYRTKSGLVH